MTRPEDIPQDIWDTAFEALHPLVRKQYEISPFSMVQHLGMARAILAERERCAKILMTRHENHPQNGEQWDGTFYDLAEEIMGQFPRAVARPRATY